MVGTLSLSAVIFGGRGERFRRRDRTGDSDTPVANSCGDLNHRERGDFGAPMMSSCDLDLPDGGDRAGGERDLDRIGGKRFDLIKPQTAIKLDLQKRGLKKLPGGT